MPDKERTAEERVGEQIEIELPYGDAAAHQARAAVRKSFTRWGLGVLVDDVVLAVSELVTNAVRHGLPPVRLTICQSAGRVRIDVSDMRPATNGLEWPVLACEDSAESGRGRGIVEAVSDHSGMELADGDGKSSYASWDVDPHKASPG
ncbi:MAG TPA: ATP-binding protein [Mycobacteriales bacterium]|nr:ATP-binding protein [Mycobacteriales bacterium]